MHSLDQAALFLVTTLFNLYLWILMIRVILYWQRANYFNPLSQFILRTTDIFIKPIKRFVPTLKGIEVATIVVFVIVELLKLSLIFILVGIVPSPIILGIQFIADILSQILNLYFYLIIIIVIASWLGGIQQNPAIYLLNQITEPVLRLGRRIIPPIAGFDFSPIIIIIIIKLLDILVVMPLFQIGIH